MEWHLVRRDVAWVWPTTTAHRARETGHPYVQAALCLPRRDLERPKRWDLRQERPTAFLSQSDGLDKRRETSKEQRDAPCGPCRLLHERRAWILAGHFRLELLKTHHSSHQGNITKPPLFLYMNIHSSMHAFIHSIHPRHRMCSSMHHNAPCCVTNRENNDLRSWLGSHNSVTAVAHFRTVRHRQLLVRRQRLYGSDTTS